MADVAGSGTTLSNKALDFSPGLEPWIWKGFDPEVGFSYTVQMCRVVHCQIPEGTICIDWVKNLNPTAKKQGLAKEQVLESVRIGFGS